MNRDENKDNYITVNNVFTESNKDETKNDSYVLSSVICREDSE